MPLPRVGTIVFAENSRKNGTFCCRGCLLFIALRSGANCEKKAVWLFVILHPLRGASFLVPTRKDGKKRLGGGVGTLCLSFLFPYGTAFPDTKTPSPETPSRHAARDRYRGVVVF